MSALRRETGPADDPHWGGPCDDPMCCEPDADEECDSCGAGAGEPCAPDCWTVS